MSNFWYIILRLWADKYQNFQRTSNFHSYPEDGRSLFVLKGYIFIPKYKVLYPTAKTANLTAKWILTQ
jgi:hypothetical protein